MFGLILLHDFSFVITSELFSISLTLLTQEEHETESFGAMVKTPNML